MYAHSGLSAVFVGFSGAINSRKFIYCTIMRHAAALPAVRRGCAAIAAFFSPTIARISLQFRRPAINIKAPHPTPLLTWAIPGPQSRRCSISKEMPSIQPMLDFLPRAVSGYRVSASEVMQQVSSKRQWPLKSTSKLHPACLRFKFSLYFTLLFQAQSPARKPPRPKCSSNTRGAHWTLIFTRSMENRTRTLLNRWSPLVLKVECLRH